MSDYNSFLVCIRDTHVDVYQNGLPLGIVKDGVFQVHQRTLPDGTKQPVKIDTVAADRVSNLWLLIADGDSHSHAAKT